MDMALQRKMAQEFSSIGQTTFWAEYVKALRGKRDYNSQTLETKKDEWDLARAQGGISAIDSISRLPSVLTGTEKSPDE